MHHGNSSGSNLCLMQWPGDKEEQFTNNVWQKSMLPSYSKMRLKRRFSTTSPLPDFLFTLWFGAIVFFCCLLLCIVNDTDFTTAHLKPYCKDRLLGAFLSSSLHTVGRDWGIVEVHLILNCYFILPWKKSFLSDVYQ